MKNILYKPYRQLLLVAGLTSLLTCTDASAQGIKTKQNYIRVDQFGYLPEGKKVAVIADAISGFNSAYGIDLNASVDVTLRRASDNVAVKTARATAWNGGATDGLSGDKGWWFDFSDISTPGEYYVQVTEAGGATVNSGKFRIAADVYKQVLKRAMQMFYYQRSDFNKTAAYAGGTNWTDGPWYAGTNQDRNALYLNDNSVRKDMRGGWIDAGDPNKYVNFAAEPVHNLLTTYAQHPAFWNAFVLDIPESSNTAPDILDEVKYEIDWIRRMQADNGGVYTKVGILNDYRYISPPSADTRSRYFDQICANSTITAAGMMAHAAAVYRTAGVFSADVTDLTTRAERAWDFYSTSNNKAENCDGGEIEAGDADGPGDQYSTEHAKEAVVSAIYLFQLTGKAKYHDHVKANYRLLRPWESGGEWSIYRSNHGEAALNYTLLATADATVKAAIIAKKTEGMHSTGSFYSVGANDNLYRAKPFYNNWGSNSLLSRLGYINYEFVNYNLLPANHAAYKERAGAIVNYMHGVNPFGMVYLTNMYGEGAELSADEIYHTWFNHGTRYDNIGGSNVGPPPGYLQGGPNSTGTRQYLTMKVGNEEFPANTTTQPDQKAFSVSNEGKAKPGGGYEAPYAFNEPAIYYQASYVKLLANFVAASGGTAPVPTADDVVSVAAPTSVNPGQAVGVSVNYSATTARDIRVKLQTAASPYTSYATGTVRVAAGTGTVNVPLTVASTIPLGSNTYVFQTFIMPSGGTFDNRLDELLTRNISAVAAPAAATTRTDNVFTEGFGTDWADWSYTGTANATDGLAQAGTRAFKFDFSGNGAVSFRHAAGKTGTDLVGLEFWARTYSGNASFRVSASYDDDYANKSAAKAINVTPTYQKFTITKAELSSFGWYKRLFIEGAAGQTIYLDEVKLVYNQPAASRMALSARAAASGAGGLSVYPNPTAGRFEISLFVPTAAGTLQAVLYDALGRAVVVRELNVPAGATHAALDVHSANLPAGVYQLRLSAADGQRLGTAPLLLQR